MSPGEVIVMLASTILASILWGAWYLRTSAQWPERRPPPGRGPLWIAPVLASALILTVLRTIAAHDVVDDLRYIHMYFALGLAWVGAAARAFPAAGLHMRDDAVERRNPAVAPAIGGAIVGVAAAYAGANVGDGPGWWVVVASALVATAGLMLAWQVLEAVASVAESVTVERDVAAGWRLGGFLVATGLVLGRAVAGDWVGLEETVVDAVRFGWPVLVLLGLAVLLERGMRVTVAAPSRPVATHGVLPALAMVALAVAWIVRLGMPR